MQDPIQNLVSGNYEVFSTALIKFLNNYSTKLKFDEFNENKLREKIWETLFDHLKNHTHTPIHSKCLAALRILSRDKTNLDDLITIERLDLILQNAGLAKICEEENVSSFTDVTTESVKLLCNLLYNSRKVQNLITRTSYLSCLIERISKYDDKVPHEIKLFDVRILFLITALNVTTRKVVKDDLRGDYHLIKMLEGISNNLSTQLSTVKEGDVLLACEVLKALFNLYIHIDDTSDESDQHTNLVQILFTLLVDKNNENQDELQSNIVNLLTVVPNSSYAMLIPPVSTAECQPNYENADMRAVSVLLDFLNRRLNCKIDLIENLSPIVTALIKIIRSQRLARKYARQEVLPPLKDVMHRPEEGTTLRAKLCKLLTTPITELRDLVAEFLFILCKENVARMVKYTGYGNAAGMFANKGLLGRQQSKVHYSSESEDSDTEEYTKYRENINPVVGCYESPKVNPLEGMSEEQKEYEAMKLVGLMDQLTKGGLVTPCRIGEDGKPKPVEHVLQLQEALPEQQINHQDSDSD